MQDFTGVPAVVDLAAMRDAVARPAVIRRRSTRCRRWTWVIDHSVMVDRFGSDQAFEQNVEIEMQRNGERYEFLRWGQQAFDNFSVVPPGTGICHRVNLRNTSPASCLDPRRERRNRRLPGHPVGTDSHTTMINGLGVLGWGVGGIGEAAMLGQPVSMLIPEVIGFRLSGKLNEGVTATDRC